MSDSFVHLHCHSEFSLLDGAARVVNLVKQAKEFAMPAVAITDHGTMFGVIEFYKEAMNAGIKPIIGCEVYVAQRTRFQKEAKKDDSPYHLVLLAENELGYQNLMTIVSSGFLEGFYYKPRVDRELLEKHHHGLIALSGCLSGEVATWVLAGNLAKARESACFYRDVFGKDNYYLEMHDHDLNEQKVVNKALQELAKEENIPLVASNDVHYIKSKDAVVHDVLLCIQTGKSVSDTDRMKFESQEMYFKSASDMMKLFVDCPEAITNTLAIAERCRVKKDFSQRLLPGFTNTESMDSNCYLEKVCRLGMQNRYGIITAEIESRIEYELKVIKQMDYADYFLIIWDLIQYAKRENIAVGPGRGSAAGSLVAYCLEITNIEPLGHGLLFERFLNPERITMPDIDIDFSDDKRDRVIKYVSDKYGRDKVAQIITFGTMAARAAVRDVGRALAIPYHEVDKIAKMVPNELKMTIKKALKQSKELSQVYKAEEKYRHLLDTSMAVEGMPRHASIHAAGVVISSEPLVNHVPLYRASDGNIVTQFPMNTLEDIGLLKMDFLGLKTLSIISEALKNIKKRHNIQLDIDKVPLDDQLTFQLLSKGETTGIFQLESSGMRSVLRELVPSKFEDIIAVVALYRPGPMEQIPVFIKSKHGKKKIKYSHSVLEPVLNETYGVIVYQEQIMEIAACMAGFSLGQADLLRRAIGKKKKNILDEQRNQFIQGCQSKGFSRELATEIYDLILKFADYGFNKSHAAAYAMIAYQTAYLKANYPVEFLTALMTVYYANSDKVALYITDCKRLGIDVLPPDINESEIHFTVIDDKTIRFGLAAVKNVGLGAIDSIIMARDEKSFVSLRDFATRVDLRACNRKVTESLIKCGAFDSLGGHRAQYLAYLDDALAEGHSIQWEKEVGQISVFSLFDKETKEDMLIDKLPALECFTDQERLSLEKEIIGLYISGHPLEHYRTLLDNMSGLSFCAELEELGDNKLVEIGGIIVSVRKFYTKKNKLMAFLKVEDLTGSLDVIVFPDLYERKQDILTEDSLLCISGRTDIKEDEEIKILAESIRPLKEKKEIYRLNINTDEDQYKLQLLKEALAEEQGNVPVCLYFKNENRMLMLSEEYWVSDLPSCLERLESILGPGTVQKQAMKTTK